MGYLHIQEREDIDFIIGQTLSDYYQTSVCVRNTFIDNCFILNPRLNSAVFEKPSEQVKKAVQISHAVHRNVLLNKAAKLYIRFGFSKRAFFGCKYIVFDELPEGPQDVLIMPGNMKIKIFDYNRRKIINLLKKGFDRSSYLRELEVRSNENRKQYVLPLKQITDGTYEEDLISGCSLDRLNRKIYPEVEDDLAKIILDFQKGNRSEVLSSDYLAEIEKKVLCGLNNLDFDKAKKTLIARFVENLKNDAKGLVTVSDSHGDLQNGNIFISDDKHIWLLDWETYGIRSIGYDILTYYYKFRYRTDYLMRINDFLNDDNWSFLSSRFWGRDVEKEQALAVYLAEDVLWLIEESLSTEEKRPSPGLLKYSDPDFQNSVSRMLKN